jgi:hypothetical protein
MEQQPLVYDHQSERLHDLYSFIPNDWSLRSFEKEVKRQPERFKMYGTALLYQALWRQKESYFFFIEHHLNQIGCSVRPIELWTWIPTFLIQLHIDRRIIPFSFLAQLFSRDSVILAAKQHPLPILWPENYRFYRKMSETCDPETILFWCNYAPNPMPKRLSLFFQFISQNDHTALRRFESTGMIKTSLEHPKDHSEFPFLFFIHKNNLDFILQYFPLLDIIEFLKIHMKTFGNAISVMEDIRTRCIDLFPLPKDIIFQILDIHLNKKKN